MAILSRMYHPFHQHELELVFEQGPYECDACKELGLRSCYTCKDPSCNFHLHECCARPRDLLFHRFFENCSFRFVEFEGPDRACYACGMPVRGFVYHCDGRDYYLHPCCANLENAIQLDGVLRLFLQKKMSSNCDCCGMKKLQKISTWAYVSECRNYTFHISCLQELLRKSLMRQGGEGSSTSEEGGGKLVKITPTLDQLIIVRKNKGSAPVKLAKLMNTIKLVISFIVAAILGDPTAMAAGVVANMFSNK